MLFSCSSCSTKYRLPDEKVAGKVLKIRCKKCSAVIVVRDPKLTASGGGGRQAGVDQKAPPRATRQAPPPPPVPAPKPPAPEQPVWFVGIAGKQEGPMTLSRLAQLSADRKVTLKSYVWRGGMGDWVRAETLPELVTALARAERDNEEAQSRSRAHAEADAKRRAEERARKQAEAKRQAEEQARKQAEAKRQAEEQARRQAEAKRQAEEQARRQARRQAEEQARRQAEEQARRQADTGGLAPHAGIAPEPPVVGRDPDGQVPTDEVGASTVMERTIPSGLLADLADVGAGETIADLLPSVAPESPRRPEPSPALQPSADLAGPAPPAEKRASAAPQVVAAPSIPDIPAGPVAAPQAPATAAPPVPAPAAPAAGSAASPPIPAVPGVTVEPSRGLASSAAPSPGGPREPSAVFGEGVDPDAAAALDKADFDDFFDAPSGGDLFDDFDQLQDEPDDARVSKQDKADFKRQMKEAALALDELDFSSAPMPDKDSLRQEFSLLIRLDKQNKKRYLGVALAGVALIALVTVGVIVVSKESDAQAERNLALTEGGGDKIVLAEYMARYDDLLAEVESEDPELADELRKEIEGAGPIKDQKQLEAMKKKIAKRRKKRRTSSSKKRKVDNARSKADEKSSKGTGAYRKLSDEEYKALMTDDSGKSETKVAGASSIEDRAKAVAKEAALKKKQVAGERAAKVAKAFAKKVRQFARCKGDDEEKLKVIFEVNAIGRVSSTAVKGTKDGQKASCVKNILKRAVFPQGNGSAKYRQTITL